MKIVAINSSYRHKGTTTRLTREALDGAEAKGAETSMIMLRDHHIEWCNNCLKCYNDLEPELSACSLDDDMTSLLRQILDADGIIFASPIHNGHLTGLMVLFFERMVFRVCRPTGTLLGLGGVPEPRTGKVRAMASIVSAGGMPEKLRKFCDGTPWLKDNACMFLNGAWIGDLYAAAHLKKLPEAESDWARLYHMRELSQTQLQKARRIGESMAEAIARGNLTQTQAIGGIMAVAAGLITRFMKLYRTVDQVDRQGTVRIGKY